GSDVTGTRIYGMRFIDSGEQFIKINTGGGGAFFSDDGAVECSFFQLTDAGRPHIERSPGGCYTGGIDAHSAQGWVVRNNEFRDIYCAGEGLAEHAVHFWSGSRDTLVENNTILNCARGIGFGLIENGVSRDYADDPYPGVAYIGHYDGLIRNNVIFGDIEWYDTGVELSQARGARVYHNTIWSTAAATGWYRSIDYRYANTDVDIRNNLVRQIGARSGAMGRVESNAEGVDASTFVDIGMSDFHLAAGATVAIDQGVDLGAAAGVDMDGETHDSGSAPDLGADERP
ncbi:MAG: right-handed parallel beta-helix repeat-containing protein, partial [Deltaproteobacteria bacterium]|nr:right-handed parallel beta-helix repeat-containing protein [Deltaproteobacteria bacterium]